MTDSIVIRNEAITKAEMARLSEPAPPAEQGRMNRRIAASIELQRPTFRELWRSPEDLTATDVCPACKRPTTRYHFTAEDGNLVETHHCPEHGDVCPVRSHIANISQGGAR